MNSRRRRIAAWFAAFALSLNALWPVLAQAKPGEGPTLVEVCTAQGVQRIAVAADSTPQLPPGPHDAPHCAFCSVGTDPLLILPAQPLALPAVEPASSAPPVEAAVRLPSTPQHPPAQPRAPPVPV